MPDALVTKRILLTYTQGPLKDVTQIIGFVAETEAIPSCIQGPRSIGNTGHIVEFASLVKVERRYALYRELLPRPSGMFSEEFPRGMDPHQV